MAMSRSLGGTLLTTREPMRISPPVMFSSPAIMRSRVDLPQPDGPDQDDELAVLNVHVDAVDDLRWPHRPSSRSGFRQTPYRCLSLVLAVDATGPGIPILNP